MAENFLYDEAGVTSFTNEVKEYLQDYNNHIVALESLANNIAGSSAWQDETVKTSFVNTLQSYIKGYKSFAIGIEGYVECMRLKSENVSDHEQNYS